MENISAMIANLGFPIAVSIYLLIRIEGKMQALTDSINELSKNIHNWCKEKNDNSPEQSRKCTWKY